MKAYLDNAATGFRGNSACITAMCTSLIYKSKYDSYAERALVGAGIRLLGRVEVAR